MPTVFVPFRASHESLRLGAFACLTEEMADYRVLFVGITGHSSQPEETCSLQTYKNPISFSIPLLGQELSY